MKRAVIVVAAAAVSSLSIAATSAPAATGLNGPTTAPSAIHTISSENSKSNYSLTLDMADSNVRSAFSRITIDALNPTDMDALVSNFNGSACRRIMKESDYNHKYGADLDAQIDQLSKTWKEKYGHAFNFDRVEDAFGKHFASIEAAAPGENSGLISQVTKATGETVGAHPMLANRPIALAKIKAAYGLPALQVALVYEKAGNWKVLAPESLTSDQIRSNLQRELRAVNDHSAKLPSSESAAYQQVGHRILMAVLNKRMPAGEQASAKPQVLNHNTSAVASTAAPIHPTVPATPTMATQSTHHWWKFWSW